MSQPQSISTITEPEFNLPDEERRHQVKILRRCPWCGWKPEVQKRVFSKWDWRFEVVHPKGLVNPQQPCGFGQGIGGKSMREAINLWNFAVALTR